MAFIKVKDKKGKEDAIINTDMICRIAKQKVAILCSSQAETLVLLIMNTMKPRQRKFSMPLVWLWTKDRKLLTAVMVVRSSFM